ncbi:5'-nucleotidase C-terminal domain-containing protein [Halovivax sp.]|uniref:bifunctional metallophosphatase/5'-nucleotidase n=1 Tax=Halovivax sp. TaxID=1935978 RepID=UPI0025BA22C0|nr:5'-nucleotidase C-terminal domain-containing protein [Halovivax sp.]
MSTPRLLHLADLETIYDDHERVGRLAGAISARRDERTLVVGSGDTTALGALAFVREEGRALARPFYEEIAPDADTLGNHEFDFGVDAAAAWARTTPGRHLAANVDGLPDGAAEPSAVLEVAGTRVGFVGVTHPDTGEIAGIDLDVSFGDPVAAVRAEAERLRSRGCDRLVFCSHCGSLDAEIAAETDVDAVLGGHDHDRVVERVDGTLVARTRGGQAGEFQVVELDDPPTVAVRTIADELRHDPVEVAYRERREASGLDERVGTLPRALDRRETAALVADAYRVGGDADVGLVAPGSVRDGLPASVTRGDVIGVVPFGSVLHVREVSGRTVAGILACCEEPVDETHGRIVAAGLERGADGAALVGGEPLDPDGTYRVASMSYLTVADVIPGLGADTVAEDRGPQHEHVLGYVEDGRVGTNVPSDP